MVLSALAKRSDNSDYSDDGSPNTRTV